uniref:Uncharacterized protein n=1 Tax=Arundo donax TaxID=35708 RepID=A0A0A9G248_ARUDO
MVASTTSTAATPLPSAHFGGDSVHPSGDRATKSSVLVDLSDAPSHL